jgi:alkylation response protein AidB-like acyl-CoA dehydrogenase
VTQEFEFTDDFFDLKAMLREFCAEASSEEAVRDAMNTDEGFDRRTWQRLGGELGVLSLAVPTDGGGDGAGLVFAAAVAEELGAALFCGPVLGTLCLAIPMLSSLSDAEVRDRYLPALMSGQAVAAVVLATPDGTFHADHASVTARADGESWMLDGKVEQVVDGAAADTLLVVARTADGTALFAVDGGADGLDRTPLCTLDLTRRQARVTFASCPARLLADESETPESCARTLRTACVLLAAEQVGGSQRMLDATVEHVSSRLQFGQPVGAFQAVKHRCANMLVALEQARSAVYHAAWALEDSTDDAQLATSLARAVASEAYLWISTSAIQLHGGLGFTWEGSPHLYFKRATTDALLLGTVQDHVELVAVAALDADRSDAAAVTSS